MGTTDKTPELVNIKVDGRPYQVPTGTMLVDACEQYAGTSIPQLCRLKGFKPLGACRLCGVEIVGGSPYVTSCDHEVAEGMSVLTHSKGVTETRQVLLQAILASHPQDCLSCPRSRKSCKLQELANEQLIAVDGCLPEIPRQPKCEALDTSSVSIIRDPNKCINCGKCVIICNEVQSVGALGFMGRGVNRKVSTPLGQQLADTKCVNCGQCIHVCPVAGIMEQTAIPAVRKALDDPNKVVATQVAPAVRVALAKEFGLKPGLATTGKLYAAFRRLGFDKVFDTNFTADLTIMEEGSELIERVTQKGILPLITSCCPGWVKFAEEFYPDLLPHLSSCKSPQQMFGALLKSYYSETEQLDPASIVSVSVMPCTAKKFEAARPEMNASGHKDVDHVLTTRELIRMIRASGIDFASLPDEEADPLMGEYTGAATIFGTTGGVAEAAVRTVYYVLTGNELEQLDLHALRGFAGIRTATVTVAGIDVKIAIAHGCANARVLLDEIRAGKSPYHFIEIMACPGGCVGGGGQPIGFEMPGREERAMGLFKEDKNLKVRQSHHNGAVKTLYEKFLKKPLGHLSHKLLHTKYLDRSRK